MRRRTPFAAVNANIKGSPSVLGIGGNATPAAPAITVVAVSPSAPRAGDVLAADVSMTGTPWPSLALAWEKSTDGATWTAATAPVTAVLGERYRVTATASNGVGAPAVLLSAATPATVAAAVAPSISSVTINNTSPSVGSVLSVAVVAAGSPAPTYTYAWKADGTTVGTSTTYTVQAGDIGKAITCTVTASNGVGSPASLTSAATSAVVDVPAVTVTGIVMDGDSIYTPTGLVDKVAAASRLPAQTFGFGGDTMANGKNTIPAAYNPANANILIANFGHNDLAFGGSLTQLKIDAAAYVTAGKAGGYEGVYLCTIAKCAVQSGTSFDWSSQNDTDAQAYGEWLLAGGSGATGVINNRAIPELQDPNNATYFGATDRLHPTEFGNYFLAEAIRAFFGFAQAPAAQDAFGSASTRGTLSGGNRIYSTTTPNVGFGSALLANGKTTGKLYVEFQCITAGQQGFGFARSGFNLDDILGGNGVSCSVFQNANSFVSGVTLANAWSGPNIVGRQPNDIIMLAIDLDAGKAWAGKDGVWAAGGNPATGANPWVTFTPGGIWFPGVYEYTDGAYSIQVLAKQVLPPPAGFSAWA